MRPEDVTSRIHFYTGLVVVSGAYALLMIALKALLF